MPNTRQWGRNFPAPVVVRRSTRLRGRDTERGGIQPRRIGVGRGAWPDPGLGNLAAIARWLDDELDHDLSTAFAKAGIRRWAAVHWHGTFRFIKLSNL